MTANAQAKSRPARTPIRPPSHHARSADVGEPLAAQDARSRGERLQKVLAAAGVASRRECEQLILDGRVEVDGSVISELGVRVDRTRQVIRVDGEPLARTKRVYVAINKPAGVVSTARDPAGRPRVIDLLPPSFGRVFTVGRLDLASEGLILATNDGELAHRLMHPRHGVRKTYEVQVAGHLDPEILAQLRRGVHLSEGFARAVDARIKSRTKKSSLLEMVLDEGRNREVRRLLARVGHKVQRLTRVAVGPIRLGDLPRGAHRMLSPEEVRKLREVAEDGASGENNGAHGARRSGPSRRSRLAPAARLNARKTRPRRATREAVEGSGRVVLSDEPDIVPRTVKRTAARGDRRTRKSSQSRPRSGEHAVGRALPPRAMKSKPKRRVRSQSQRPKTENDSP